MAWYYINIPPYSIPGSVSGTGTRLGPMYSDFGAVLLLTKNSRALTQTNVQLFQWMGTAWQQVQVA